MKSDHIIREKLYHMDAAYPTDLWSKIAEQLPEEKTNKKPFFLLFLIGTLLIAMYGVSSFYQGENSSSLNATGSLAETSSPIAPAPINEGRLSVLDDNEDENSDIDNGTTKSSSAPIPQVKKKTATETFNHTLPEKNKVNTNKPVINKFSTNQQELTQENLHPTSDLKNNEPTSTTLPGVRSEVTLAPSISSLPIKLENDRSYFFETLEDPECPSFYDDKLGLYADIYWNHEYGLRSLSSKSSEFSDYVEDRNNTETGLYSFSAGARISFIMPSGIGIKTGINYGQINEKFTFFDPDASMIRTVITIDTILVDGMETVVSDTTRTEIPGSSDITTFNRLRTFDIPLLASYSINLNGRWYAEVNAGALFNVTLSKKGRILDSSGDPMWFGGGPTQERIDVYAASAGVSLYLGAGLHYVWNDTFDLILEPNLTYNLKTLTLDSYSLDQKYTRIGLITGVRYKF